MMVSIPPKHAVSQEVGFFREFATRDMHSFVLKADGSLWARGGNSYGHVGDDTISRLQPVRIGTSLLEKADHLRWLGCIRETRLGHSAHTRRHFNFCRRMV